MRRSLLLSLLGGALLAWPSAAAAQTVAPAPSPPPSSPAPAPDPAPPPDPPPAKDPVEVRIIGSKADSLQKIPGSGQIITAKEIQNAQPYDAAEMLNRVPGVTARQEQEGGARLDIGVRGLDPGRSRNLLILEDGIPMSLNPYAEPDLYIAPQIDRMRGIEVLKGSGSILFGPSTIGGVINFLTIAPPARQTAVLEADYGSFNYKKVLAQYGDTFGSARYVIQGTYKAGDGFEALPFQTTDVFAKVAIDTSKTGQAILKLGFHDDATYADDIGLTREMFAQNPGQNSLAPYDRMHQRRYAASVDPRGADRRLHHHPDAYLCVRDPAPLAEAGLGPDPVRSEQPFGGRAAGFPAVRGGLQRPRRGHLLPERRHDPRSHLRRCRDRAAPGVEVHDGLGGAQARVRRAGPRRDGRVPAVERRSLRLRFGCARRAGDAPDGRGGDLPPGHDGIPRRPRLHPGAPDRARGLPPHRPSRGRAREPHEPVPRRTDLPDRREHPGRSLLDRSDPRRRDDLRLTRQPPLRRHPLRLAAAAGRLVVQPGRDAVSGERADGDQLRDRSARRAGEVVARRGHRVSISYENEVIAGAANSGDNEGLMNGGPTRHVGAEASALAGIGRAMRWKTQVDFIARYSLARATFVGGPYSGNIVPYAPLNTFSTVLDVNHPSGFGGEVAFYFTDSEYADPNNTRAEDATGVYGLIPAHTDLDGNVHYKNAATGLSVRLAVKDALQDYYITERRPNGIAVGGFRQVMLGVRWDWEAKEKPVDGR